MTLPLVEALSRLGPVTVAARTRAMGDVFREMNRVAVEIIGSSPVQAFSAHRRLARSRPDLYVVPVPSNRWQYAALAVASGAKRVVMHSYPVGRYRSLRPLLGVRRELTLVEARRGLHDVEQNLRLLGPLGGEIKPFAPRLPLTPDEMSRAGNGLFDSVVLQPGCGNTLVGRVKRWPADRFAALADALMEQGHRPVVIEGPDERGVGRSVASLCRMGVEVVELRGSLRDSAAMLARARLFVGTDSGLAHVAAAVGTPAVTLFAAADPERVAPYGCGDLVVTPRPVDGMSWTPRLLYPMDHPGPKLRHDGIDWARHIELDDVLAAVERGLRRQAQPQRRGGARAAV
jgi:ADP-heptose:LPS heptosyltransferase